LLGVGAVELDARRRKLMSLEFDDSESAPARVGTDQGRIQ
jgi:hypothetical protein